MQEEAFRFWLTVRYPNSNHPSSVIARCKRLEDVYGPLDDAYELNHCTGIEAELYITKDAQRKGERPMHGIAISGDVYEVTANLKNALKLYVEFKDQH